MTAGLLFSCCNLGPKIDYSRGDKALCFFCIIRLFFGAQRLSIEEEKGTFEFLVVVVVVFI